MEIIKYPSRETWETIVRRPQLDVSQLHETVNTILEDVQNNGDKAVLDYEKKFDHANLESLAVSEQEICDAMKMVSEELLDALKLAHQIIKAFHKAQQFHDIHVETAEGVSCWQKKCGHRKSGLVHSWRHGTFIQHCFNACHTSKDCRVQGYCSLYPTRP